MDAPHFPGSCHHERPCLLLHLMSAPYACCLRCSLERLEHIAELAAQGAPEQTPGSAPQTGHSGARKRRNQGGPGQREPTR